MVNKNIKITTPVSTGAVLSTTGGGSAGAVSTPGSSSGASSNTGASSAGGGTASSASPTPVSLPAPTMPGSGFRKEVTAIVNGLGSSIPADSTVLVNGQQMSQQSLVTALQAVLALYAAVDASVQAAKSNRLILQAALPNAHQLVTGIKAGLIALFGKGNPALIAFGFSGTKPKAQTVEEKTASKAKAAATRALHGPSGKRQKAAVKFTGTVQVQTNLSGTQAAAGSTPASAGSNSGASSSAPAGSSGSGSSTSSSGA